MKASRRRATCAHSPSRRCGRRGATLTERLLGFARRRPYRGEAVHAGRLSTGLIDMLRRTLGEDVEPRVTSAPDLWHSHVGPGQLEQAILNLANNARDAMPEGGALHIALANLRLAADEADLPAGDYVEIAVADSGTGMSDAVTARIFDPFFSTKDVGKGTGPGLSMVYGFARQSEGRVSVESREGGGTRHSACTCRDPRRQRPPERAKRCWSWRTTATSAICWRACWAKKGYRVLSAGSAPAVHAVLAGAGHIDLLPTDVVLPDGMSGKGVAAAVQARLPACRVL